MEDASAMGARLTMIVGKEVSSGVVTLRDMRDRSEQQVPFEEGLAHIKSVS